MPFFVIDNIVYKVEPGTTLGQLRELYHPYCWLQEGDRVISSNEFVLSEGVSYTLALPYVTADCEPFETFARKLAVAGLNSQALNVSYIACGCTLHDFSNSRKSYVVRKWLKVPLPQRSARTSREGYVDFSAPYSFNPLFRSSQSPFSAPAIAECSYLIKRSPLVMDFQYAIYLNCFASTASEGHYLSHNNWQIHVLRDSDNAKFTVYTEIAARCIVLRHMLEQHGAQFTPMHWLLYMFSIAGGKQIDAVRTTVYNQRSLTLHGLFMLLRSVEDVMRNASLHNDLVIYIEQQQHLQSLQVPLCPARGNMEKTSVLDVVYIGTQSLSLDIYWTGKRVRNLIELQAVTAKKKGIIEKAMPVPDSDTLSAQAIKRCLKSVLDLSAVAKEKYEVIWAATGTQSSLAQFVSLLFTPSCEAMELAMSVDVLNNEIIDTILTHLLAMRLNNQHASQREFR